MASDEHLKRVAEGRDAWNRWRAENFGLYPDLSETILSGIDLSGYNLTGVDLAWTFLENADLSGAALGYANCFFTQLETANLNNARLDFTRFAYALLDGAIFTDATIGGTVFANVYLDNVIGLDRVKHRYRSTLGIDTLINSPNLPEEFLRGCGVPEEFVQYLSSLYGQAIEYYSCFISYSSHDEEFARRLYNDLQARKIRTWFAPEDLKIGDHFRSRIDESIRFHDKLVLILSARSIDSAWVEDEVERALGRERRDRSRELLFPIRLDDVVFDTDRAWARGIIDTRHVGDFRNWKDADEYAKALDRLVRDLKRHTP
jgi:hypothetical protein